jgi:hypothetical protein
MNETEALLALAQARRLQAVVPLIQQLEKSFGFTWSPVGGRETNFGQIEIGSDPGYALVERVTNAIDAVIEREALRADQTHLPDSPREACQVWLGVPGGCVANLRTHAGTPDHPLRQRLANNVVIRLLEGASRRKPTVEIRDIGVGITAAAVSKTILSLGESNKVDKTYLAGAYGQGGSTTFAFSKTGTLIVSRRQPDLLPNGVADHVAVTFVRFNELDPRRNKNGRYEYLVGPKGEVASIPIDQYAVFEAGTQVLHFDMEIEKYAQRMTQLTGSLWWLLQNALFDPVIPIWVEEGRPAELKQKKSERRVIVGNYTRLTDGTRPVEAAPTGAEDTAPEATNAATQDLPPVEHADSIDVEADDKGGTVRVNYWVLREREDSSDVPIAAYVDAYRPIAYTVFGQLHGTDERKVIADRLQLPNLVKSLVVQVELDGLTPAARRQLLSTTRDRLKQTPAFERLREQICSAMIEDESLRHIDQQRKEKLLARQSDKDRDKIKRRMAKLMEKFHAGVDATAPSQGDAQGGRQQRPSSGDREPLQPLPTKDEPTFIQISNKKKPIPIQVGRSAVLRLESDAPDRYLARHVHARLTIVCEPEGLVTFESRSDFRGGRARVALKTTAAAQVGREGSITVFLLTPNHATIQARTTFVLEATREDATTGEDNTAKVQVPEPHPITKDRWHEFPGWDEKTVSEVREDQTSSVIYVNIDNKHIGKLLNAGGYQQAGLQRMKNNYLLYVGFYSYIQHVSEKKYTALDAEQLDRYQRDELDRLAQTVVHAISAAGRTEQDDD